MDYGCVKGDTLGKLKVTLRSSTGVLDLTGATVRLQMRSPGAASIDLAGTVTDAVNGVCEFQGIGNQVSSMNGQDFLAYEGLVRVVDSAAKVGYSDPQKPLTVTVFKEPV